MTAFSLGSIRAILAMDSSSYTGGILNAQALNSVFGQSFTTFITNPVLGGISIFKQFAGSAISLGQEILADAEALQRLNDQTEVSVEVLQALRAEFDLAGRSTEVADRAARNYTLRLGQAQAGSQELAAAFQQLGINIRSIEDTDGSFRIIIQRLGEMEDRSRANALAAKIFGEEAGPQLLQTIGSSLDQIIERQRDVGQVFSRSDIDLLADFNTTLGTTEQALDGILRSSIVSFLAGFINQTGTAQGEVVNLAGNINERLAPALRDLGGDVGELVGDLGDFVDRLTELLDRIDQIEASTRNFRRDFSTGFDAGTSGLNSFPDFFAQVNADLPPPQDLPAFTPQEIAPVQQNPTGDASARGVLRIFNYLIFGPSAAGPRVP